MINPKVVDIFSRSCRHPVTGADTADFVAAYNSGIRAILHKASQGLSYHDAMYQSRKPKILNAKLKHGAYHYLETGSPEAQIHSFLDFANPDKDTALMIDHERNPRDGRIATIPELIIALHTLEDKTGRKGIVYSGNNLKEQLQKMGKGDPYISSHRLMLAEYSEQTVLPLGFSDYWLKQFTGDGSGPMPHSVPGIGSGIDISTYKGSDEQLAAEWTGFGNFKLEPSFADDSWLNYTLNKLGVQPPLPVGGMINQRTYNVVLQFALGGLDLDGQIGSQSLQKIKEFVGKAHI